MSTLTNNLNTAAENDLYKLFIRSERCLQTENDEAHCFEQNQLYFAAFLSNIIVF